MLFGPRRKPRGFHYESRYNADGTKKEHRPEFNFSRTKPGSAQSRRSLIFMIVLIILVVYLLIFFKRMENKVPDHTFEVEKIEIE